MRNKWTDGFLQEADDLLAEIEHCILSVADASVSAETVAQLFRWFHTLKGSSAMCGLENVASFTHHLETLLDDVREGRVGFTPLIGELVLASVDEVKSLLASARTEGSEEAVADESLIARIREASASREKEPKPATVAQVHQQSAGDVPTERSWKIKFRPDPNLFVRGGNPLGILRELRGLGHAEIAADINAVPPLDSLDPENCYLGWTILLKTSADENALRDVFLFVEDGAELKIEQLAEPDTGEGAAKGNTAAIAPSRADAIGNAAAKTANSKHPGRDSVVRVPSTRLDRLVNLVGELVMTQARLSQAATAVGAAELANPVQEMDRLIAELRDDVLGIRMLPIGTIFGRFQRLVHDLSIELAKDVSLVTSGGETELDKSILDQLGEPLVHLLRNSIDHGIETPQDRVARGKSPKGTVHLSACHRGSNVIVTVEDDGRGIDAAAVRAKAVARGLISPDAVLSDRELVNLILLPGLSTARQVTNVSGRGVGMDVVKKQIEMLRGSLSISSQQGKGTSISLSLPLTLAIIEGLIVQVEEIQFIVPMAAVTENVELTRAERAGKNGRNAISVRGELISYIDLRSELHLGGEAPSIEKVVVVSHDEGRVGLVVDRVLGTHQTVLQSLGRFFRNIHVVSGATILGDGRVALILDIPAIVHYVENQNTRQKGHNNMSTCT